MYRGGRRILTLPPFDRAQDRLSQREREARCGWEKAYAAIIHLAMRSMSWGLSASLRMTEASKPECMRQF